MKKILLFLGLALFLTAGIVTVTKIQNVNATPMEIAFVADDDSSIVTAFAEEDEKKAKKDGKCAKVKENCNKENCPESKCAEKAANKECCDKGKKKSCDKNKGNK